MTNEYHSVVLNIRSCTTILRQILRPLSSLWSDVAEPQTPILSVEIYGHLPYPLMHGKDFLNLNELLN